MQRVVMVRKGDEFTLRSGSHVVVVDVVSIDGNHIAQCNYIHVGTSAVRRNGMRDCDVEFAEEWLISNGVRLSKAATQAAAAIRMAIT